MQKNNKKASILLWAVMLSLIIAITFIAISTKINKNIKNSSWIKDFIEENNKINILKNTLTNTWITENKAIIFKDNKKNTFSLKKQEELNLTFSWTSDFNINIWLIKWADLEYKYYKNNNLTNSWIISSSVNFTWNLDSSNNTWSLKIKNLWWYSQFLINSENSFETLEKNYKIVTKIWNSIFNETKR